MTAAVVVAAAVTACVVPAWLFETLLRRYWPGLDRERGLEAVELERRNACSQKGDSE